MLAEEALTPEALVAAVGELARDTEAWRTRLREFAAPDAVAVIVGELERAAQIR